MVVLLATTNRKYMHIAHCIHSFIHSAYEMSIWAGTMKKLNSGLRTTDRMLGCYSIASQWLIRIIDYCQMHTFVNFHLVLVSIFIFSFFFCFVLICIRSVNIEPNTYMCDKDNHILFCFICLFVCYSLKSRYWYSYFNYTCKNISIWHLVEHMQTNSHQPNRNWLWPRDTTWSWTLLGEEETIRDEIKFHMRVKLCVCVFVCNYVC